MSLMEMLRGKQAERVVSRRDRYRELVGLAARDEVTRPAEAVLDELEKMGVSLQRFEADVSETRRASDVIAGSRGFIDAIEQDLLAHVPLRRAELAAADAKRAYEAARDAWNAAKYPAAQFENQLRKERDTFPPELWAAWQDARTAWVDALSELAVAEDPIDPTSFGTHRKAVMPPAAALKSLRATADRKRKDAEAAFGALLGVSVPHRVGGGL